MNTHIQILQKVLDSLGQSHVPVLGMPDALLVSGEVFIRSATPFNKQSLSILCKDKDAIYKILQDVVPIPKTKSILDPQGKHPELSGVKNINEITDSFLDFIYPCIVKMNQGERGIHVFITKSIKEVQDALQIIFDKTNRRYDYIALVQEYIKPKREIRAMVSFGKVVFCYDRHSREIISGAINSKVIALSDSILKKINLSWGAIDFIESTQSNLYFLEINTKPEFSEEFFAKHSSRVIELYQRAFKYLLSHG